MPLGTCNYSWRVLGPAAVAWSWSNISHLPGLFQPQRCPGTYALQRKGSCPVLLTPTLNEPESLRLFDSVEAF